MHPRGTDRPPGIAHTPAAHGLARTARPPAPPARVARARASSPYPLQEGVVCVLATVDGACCRRLSRAPPCSAALSLSPSWPPRLPSPLAPFPPRCAQPRCSSRRPACAPDTPAAPATAPRVAGGSVHPSDCLSVAAGCTGRERSPQPAGATLQRREGFQLWGTGPETCLGLSAEGGAYGRQDSNNDARAQR